MESLTPITLGFLGSLIAGLMTALGAVPILFGKVPSRGTRDMSLGFAAGVMLSASFFSLIIPAIESAGEMYDEDAMVGHRLLVGMPKSRGRKTT